MTRTLRRRRLAPTFHAPYWYWIVLGAVALIGIVLIAYSTLVRVNITGITAEGDYFKGNPDAPVTIIDWGNFG